MPTTTFNPEEFGLKLNNLYETIVTTYSLADGGLAIRPNAACMGIRLLDSNELEITPFIDTSTYKNIKQGSIIVINFIEDVYLFALAGLKESNSPINLKEFPSKYYEFKILEELAMNVPYINNAWGLLIGKVRQESMKEKYDEFGAVMIPILRLEVIFSQKFQDSFKLYNRAENLALEAITLATRLRIAAYSKNCDSFHLISAQITNIMSEIERFGKNKRALKTVELIKKYSKELTRIID